MLAQAYHQLLAIMHRLEHIEVEDLAELLVHHVDFLQRHWVFELVVVLLCIFDDVQRNR